MCCVLAALKQIFDPENIKAWGPVLVGLAGILFAFITQRRSIKSQSEYNIQQIRILTTKEKRERIVSQLHNFYGPLKELRTRSKAIYAKFSLKREGIDTKGRRFRTVRFLINHGKSTLSKQEDALLSEILSINRCVLKLIETQSGLADRLPFQDLLAKWCAHINILQLAYDGALTDSENYEDTVFPREIDGAIESATRRLQDELDSLTKNIENLPPKSSPKQKSDEELNYYNDNADHYESVTLGADLSDIYKSFLHPHLPRGGKILDAGCGVGRDTRFFIEQGFVVISFDASERMTEKCNLYPHAYCARKSFSEIDFKEEFDGVWCCASILHLPLEDAKYAFKRLVTAVKPNGVIFLSVKAGHGTEITKDGRFYQYYNESDLQHLYSQDPRVDETPINIWRTSSANADSPEKQQEWVNILLRRKESAHKHTEFAHG